MRKRKPAGAPTVILLAVDGSDVARAAVRYVVDNLPLSTVASDLRVIHALYRIPPRAAAAVGRSMVEGYYRSEMEDALRESRKLLDAANVRYQVVRRIGSPGVEIADYAQTQDVELVVMGSHGRGAAGDLILGSVAQTVVSNCKVPVLVVREERPQSRTGEILVPVDGSPFTRHAIAYLLRHRELFGTASRLTLMHVTAPLGMVPFPVNQRAQRAALEAEFERAMEPARRLLARAKVKAREVRAKGDPGREIGAYAREHECDLVVMGSHGRGAMTSLLLGSVTQKTLSACRTPVLIVR